MAPVLRIAWVLLGAAMALSAAGGPPGSAEREASGAVPALLVHRDPREVLEGTVEAARAYLLEDATAMRAALDRIERATRRLDRERDAALGKDLLVYEQAFHETLDRAREMSGKGDLEKAFNQFVWTQRACVTCHGIARDEGRLPPAPLSSGQHAE